MVSVTTYRDAGFLPHAFVNFLCLLGWSPKDNREQMTRQELIDAFSFEGINRSNAVVNFTDEDPFDPKAVWLNAEHDPHACRSKSWRAQLLPFACAAGLRAEPGKMLQVAPLIQERIKLLSDVSTAADFFFLDELAALRSSAELIPQKGDQAMALSRAAARARDSGNSRIQPRRAWTQRLRAAAEELKIKARPDVPAHSRRRVRPQERSAAV